MDVTPVSLEITELSAPDRDTNKWHLADLVRQESQFLVMSLPHKSLTLTMQVSISFIKISDITRTLDTSTATDMAEAERRLINHDIVEQIAVARETTRARLQEKSSELILFYMRSEESGAIARVTKLDKRIRCLLPESLFSQAHLR